MNNRWLAIVGVGLMLMLGGCTTGSTGLSPRDHLGREYSTYLFALYDQPRESVVVRQSLRLPARVAVAQIGEISPAQAIIDRLQNEPGLFSMIAPMPAIHGGLHGYYYPREATPEKMRAEIQRQLRTMQRFAGDLGADYLFLYGGTIDYGTRSTSLSVLDLTIVGAFVAPSRRVSAVARASGTLIDLRSGRVITSASAESRAQALASSTTDESTEQKLIERLRDDVSAKLGAQLVAAVKPGSEPGASLSAQ